MKNNSYKYNFVNYRMKRRISFNDINRKLPSTDFKINNKMILSPINRNNSNRNRVRTFIY